MIPGLTPTPPPAAGLTSGPQRRPAARATPARPSEPGWLTEHRRRARQLRVRGAVAALSGLIIFGAGAAAGTWLFVPVGSIALCLGLGLFAASRIPPVPPDDRPGFPPTRLG